MKLEKKRGWTYSFPNELLLSWSVSVLLWWRPYWFCLPLLSLHMLSLNLSTLLAPYAPPTPSSSDKIHPIKMHYEILHRVLHPCCTMTCGGGPVMMMMMMVMVCVPCPNKTHNQHPPTHPLTFSPPPKNIFHPLTFYYKWKQKSSHSSFYILAYVESGWFVIYLSKTFSCIFIDCAHLRFICCSPATCSLMASLNPEPSACAFWMLDF